MKLKKLKKVNEDMSHSIFDSEKYENEKMKNEFKQALKFFENNVDKQVNFSFKSIALLKTILISMITIGTSIMFFEKTFIDSLFGFVIMLSGLYLYYRVENETRKM